MNNDTRPVMPVIPLSWAAGSLLTSEDICKKIYTPEYNEKYNKFCKAYKEFLDKATLLSIHGRR